MRKLQARGRHASEIEYDVERGHPIMRAYYATYGFDFIPVPVEELEKQMRDLHNYHQEIIFLCKEYRIGNELIEILETFFSLKDEKGPFMAPSEEMLSYHRVLTLEIHKALTSKSAISYQLELMKVFLIFNFNKYSIPHYYRHLRQSMRIAGIETDDVISRFIFHVLHDNDCNKYSYSCRNKKLETNIFTEY